MILTTVKTVFELVMGDDLTIENQALRDTPRELSHLGRPCAFVANYALVFRALWA